ncbi:glycogen debranching protein [Sulfolobales archaeon HS-7]|nr:glycogen debranching protein [Sulfolobales archaeon HS-7]
MPFDLSECYEQEWLITFENGGYSSSSPCGINTRTYHGYLVLPQNSAENRYVFLSKVEDFIVGDEPLPLSTNEYLGAVYPQGYKFLDSFDWESNYVEWNYSFPEGKVRKRLIVDTKSATVSLEYGVEGDWKLRICPLITFRSHHTVKPSGFTYFTYKKENNLLTIFREQTIKFLNIHVQGNFNMEDTGYWYYNMLYRKDKENGNNYLDNVFNPFCIEISRNSTITFFTNKYKLIEIKKKPMDPLSLLRQAALSFIVKDTNYSIIAGYHWFGEWGRDSLISLEGIALLNSQFEVAKNVLERYIANSNRGLLPNSFDSEGNPTYRGVDVSLWWFIAAYKYYQYSHDLEFIRKNLPLMQDVIENYIKGNGVVKFRNGLIEHIGAPRTWMDAEFEGNVYTPREGFAVEINALWYNALRIFDYFYYLVNKTQIYTEISQKTFAKFNELFESDWGLYDYLTSNLKGDTSVRPNQIFAVSLPFLVVTERLGKKILYNIEKFLLRPYGLSTLNANDPKYRPVYEGDRKSRDAAYHNGPIWPWLIGGYIEAKIKLENDEIQTKQLMSRLETLIKYAYKNNGYIPELFDDVPPYRPRGCIAQAWSVAEVLRSIDLISKY